MGRRRAPYGAWDVLAWISFALGLVCDLVVWGVWGPVAAALGIFVLAFALAVMVDKSFWTSTRIGFEWGVVLVSSAGLLAAFEWFGALLVLTVAFTSPRGRILLRTSRLNALRRQAVADDTAENRDIAGSLDVLGPAFGGTARGPLMLVSLAEMPDADGVPTLDDDALCQAWRRSYVRLEASRGADSRLDVVRLRQLYLDELVRRHPAEVRLWLASGARAAGNPLPFLERPVFQEGPSEDGQHGHGSETG
ncbi:MAG TPA: hypothetical protein VM688_07705 [Nocardioidaceae bacterium]|jgi:hypothetical protein|nr:hypothetical protein [Nocardioidaceae bacterium]